LRDEQRLRDASEAQMIQRGGGSAALDAYRLAERLKSNNEFRARARYTGGSAPWATIPTSGWGTRWRPRRARLAIRAA